MRQKQRGTEMATGSSHVFSSVWFSFLTSSATRFATFSLVDPQRMRNKTSRRIFSANLELKLIPYIIRMKWPTSLVCIWDREEKRSGYILFYLRGTIFSCVHSRWASALCENQSIYRKSCTAFEQSSNVSIRKMKYVYPLRGYAPSSSALTRSRVKRELRFSTVASMAR